jgi:hypothetical protein
VADLDDQHWRRDFCNEGHEEIMKYLLYRNTIPNASAVIFKKSAYLRAKRSYIDMKLCGDWFLWVELLLQGNVAFHAEPLNYFRTHATTTRVLDDLKKIRLRLEEEYLILLNIKAALSKEPTLINQRLSQVREQYSSYFTRKEIMQLLLNPSRYKSPIPLRLLFTDYFKSKFVSKQA